MEDRAGVFTFMGGLIVLLGVAVTLSIAMEKRSNFFHGKSAIEETILTDREALDSLQIRLSEAQARWQQSGNSRIANAKKYESTKVIAKAAGIKAETLRGDAARLRNDVAALSVNFVKYRTDFRNQARTSAVGEKMDSLKTRNGREYQKVVITRVTESGMEIHHENGIARLLEADLTDDWRERFQWGLVSAR